MYHPYFRGKQYELITIRETAPLLSEVGFVPVIEPVKESLNGLKKCLDAICDASGKAIVIVNPHYGDYSQDGGNISTLLNDDYLESDDVLAGILLTDQTEIDEIVELCEAHSEHGIALVHAGFAGGKLLAERLGGDAIAEMKHLFFEDYCGKLYRKHFVSDERVLLRDGFEKRRNKDYPKIELYSDLHVTYEDEGVGGFGDFLTVGDDYSESGGPAYAVAIHLTFINDEDEDQMFVYHFISDRQDTPTDPAGKFGEALAKLITEIDKPTNNVLETSAVREFRDLHTRGHFPGLGYVKKLSMRHHIETLADYFSEE